MAILAPIFTNMELKDRIRTVMESQHMTQQVFADFLQLSPATLSSIYTGRTRPGLNIVEAIKSKIPDISYDWLISGVGDMLIPHSVDDSAPVPPAPNADQEGVLIFDSSPSSPPSTFPNRGNLPQNSQFMSSFPNGVKSTHHESTRDEMKIIDKQPRKVTEIRVYYDDQTYETFVPSKSK